MGLLESPLTLLPAETGAAPYQTTQPNTGVQDPVAEAIPGQAHSLPSSAASTYPDWLVLLTMGHACSLGAIKMLYETFTTPSAIKVDRIGSFCHNMPLAS